jgi:hypothetical protein
MNRINTVKDTPSSEIETNEAIDALSLILDKTDNSSSLKLFKDLVILPFINTFAPSKIQKTLLYLTIF